MIHTIGYQQRKPEQLINLLKRENIRILVDIREAARSRVPGYSKTKLKNLLEENDIEYIHIPEMGTPKWMRDKFRESDDLTDFFKLFREYILPKMENGLWNRIYNMFITNEIKPICLFCYERNYYQCHRSVISEILVEKFKGKIKHL